MASSELFRRAAACGGEGRGVQLHGGTCFPVHPQEESRLLETRLMLLGGRTVLKTAAILSSGRERSEPRQSWGATCIS